MDVKMEDVQKSPDTNEATVVTVTEAPSIAVVDGWIDSLMTCKQLSEADVQRLCEKVQEDNPGPGITRPCFQKPRY